VFLNLLNNARDAMPQGGTITLRSYASGEFVVAEVQDTGTGIAPELQPRLFEPFFTTKGVGKGTGLGLSVAYGIIRTHGGEIQVESAPARGSLFRVLLPMESTSR
jgi:signal transduction histidine kinase